MIGVVVLFLFLVEVEVGWFGSVSESVLRFLLVLLDAEENDTNK